MLKEHHGERVYMDPIMLAGLVRAGMADPELLRMQARDRAAAAFASVGDFAVANGVGYVAAAPYPTPIAHPLAPPTLQQTTISIDWALQNPTRVVTPMVLDLTATRFFVDRAFTSAGGVQGGAVIYDEAVSGTADLYADRDVQRVTPGTEFPLVTFSRRAPRAAEVEKWGGKFYYTDEARDRNDTALFTRAVRQLANTIVRKLNQRGVEILEAAITANARTITGNNWSTVITMGATPSNYTLYPQRDFARADLVAEQEEMGLDYNLWILNPQQMFELEGIYGDRLAALLNSFDIDIFVTNRVPDGTAYALAEGQAGEMRVEKPLSSESWRDPNGKEQTWVQSSVRPLMFVNNPFAVLKFVGLKG